MIKLFFDTNVILDIILDREGAQEAKRILECTNSDEYFRVYISYLSVADIAYVLRKLTKEELRKTIAQMLHAFNVLPNSDIQIMNGLKIDSPDFEDALQIACAEHSGCDMIITGNTAHFSGATDIPVMTASEFVRACG